MSRTRRRLGVLPYRTIRLRGRSMLPTLGDGDVVLARNGATPRPGDVVVVTWPSRPAQLSVKRAMWTDGDGWFVVGDNAPESTDSNHLGPARVHGVVRWRLWPRPRPLRRPPPGG